MGSFGLAPELPLLQQSTQDAVQRLCHLQSHGRGRRGGADKKMFGGVPGLGAGSLDDAVERYIRRAVSSEAAQTAWLRIMDALG